ncbi:MAG: TlpA family protein disulfide reductase [Pseudomonadota bacterium]|nr:MAG: TlpA family protein disulfide reductase [Pseudomonadota bacterium]
MVYTRIIALVLWLAACSEPAARGAQEIPVSLGEGVEAIVTVHSAQGSRLVIWLPSEHGFPSYHANVAAKLAGQGIETWQADLFSAYFLPVQPSSIDAVPPGATAALIEHAIATRKKTVYLLASGRGAVLALRGARQWQQQHPDNPALGGALLLHPNLYVGTPEPGAPADYLRIASATNLPLFVLQPALSPWRWQLAELNRRLSSGGSEVYLKKLPGLRDRFHFRPDATPEELAFAQRLPRVLASALPLLDAHARPRRAVALKANGGDTRGTIKRAVQLRPYRGEPAPPALALPDLDDKAVDLAALRGQVVLVNFWASWCPPCVHEMPSMQRLADRLAGKPFTLLAVNMAEDKATIRRFLDTKVKVDFPILLDSDGAALKRWKVFAFPTSYVIDKNGRIRYALFGSIDWDTPQTIAVFEKLLAE